VISALSRRFGAGFDGEVPSPTFTLVQTYELGPLSLQHFDCYRIERPEEAWELGIEDAMLGRYGDTDGPGIDDLVQQVDSTLANDMRAAMTAARTAILQIPVPFDQAILGPDTSPGRVAIAAAIDALNHQTDLLAQCAAALGISISAT